MHIVNNTVLITGGTSGIGLGLAKQLLALGNVVIITGRDQAKLDAAKKALNGVHVIQSDTRELEAIKNLCARVTKEFPALNVLINNAGIMRKINMHDSAFLDITSEVEINLMGPIRMVQLFLTHLKAQKEAAIVNVSSGLAFALILSCPSIARRNFFK